jgi:hypothetical protein
VPAPSYQRLLNHSIAKRVLNWEALVSSKLPSDVLALFDNDLF